MKDEVVKNETGIRRTYTPLTVEDIVGIVAEATAPGNILDPVLAADILANHEIVEYEDHGIVYEGTYMVRYLAKHWRDANAFLAAVVGRAWALGYYAEASDTWLRGWEDEDGCERVGVFITAADYMDEDGCSDCDAVPVRKAAD